jgi:hypothetical protein
MCVVDWAKELDRFEQHCRCFSDEAESGSVTLTLKFMDGRPVLCSVTDATHRVMDLTPKTMDACATVVKHIWDRMQRTNKRFFGEIVIRRLYCNGKLTEQEESSTLTVKVT